MKKNQKIAFQKPFFIVGLVLLFSLPTSSYAQLNPPYFIGHSSGHTTCGNFNPIDIKTISPSPVCYQSIVKFRIYYNILADSLYLDFGDKKDTIITAGIPPDSFDIAHNYDFKPNDTCIGGNQPDVSCPISAYFYKKCNGGSYSYASIVKNIIAFRFKPRVRFYCYPPHHQAIQLSICNNPGCFSIWDSCLCTNTYVGVDLTNYKWSFGDGSADSVYNNTTDDFFQMPVHCYTQPTSTGYLLKLHAENQCGVSEDSARIYVQEIDSVQVPPGPYCTGSAIKLHIAGQGGYGNQGYFTSVTPLIPSTGSYTIKDSATANPIITFNLAGDYTIYCRYGSCVNAVQISIDQGVLLQQNSVPDACFTGSNQLLLSDYFSSTNATQTNTFTVSDTAGILFSNKSIGSIPSTAIPLPHAGFYFISDTSVTTCNTAIFLDTFRILPQITIHLPNDTTLCLQSFFSLPIINGTTRTENGDTVPNLYQLLPPISLHSFLYTPAGCGSPQTFRITGIGTEAYCTDSSLCSKAGDLSLTGSVGGMTFTGTYVTSNIFHSDSATMGTHLFYSTYTDANNCTFIDTCTISILAPLNAAATLPDTTCVNTSVSLTIQNPTLSFSINWGDGATNSDSSHNYTSAGTFYTTVVFSNGNCDTTLLDSIVIIPTPNTLFILQPDTLCFGDTTSILFTPSPLYTYQWTYSNSTTPNPPTVENKNAGFGVSSDTVLLTINSNYCPQANSSNPIYFNPKTRALLDLKYNSACTPMPVTIANNSLVSHNADHFQWYINGNLILDTMASIASLNTLATAGNSDSTYVFSLIVNSCGVIDTATDSLVVHPISFTPVIHARLTNCVHEAVQVSSSVIPSCTVSYNFGDGTFIQAVPSTDTVSHIYDTAGNYTIRMTMFCACQTKSDSLSIKILPGPELSVFAPSDTCNNSPVTIASTISGSIAAGAYTTNFGDGNVDTISSNPSHFYSLPNSYAGWMQAKGINGCKSDTVPFNVTIYETPLVTHAFEDTSTCTGTRMFLSLDSTCSNCTYQWNVAHLDTVEKVTSYDGVLPFFAKTAGDYFVYIMAYNNNHNSCNSISDTFKITVYPSPEALFTVEAQDKKEELFYFQNHNESKPFGNTYYWNYGDSTYSYAPTPPAHGYKSGEYFVTLIAYNGQCTDTAIHRLQVNPDLQLYTPNVFTPNGDGLNDYFEIFGNTKDIDFLHVRIFDRIGEKVFESFDSNFKWDGTYKGQHLNPAVFVYVLEISAIGNPDSKTQKGSITLFR